MTLRSGLIGALVFFAAAAAGFSAYVEKSVELTAELISPLDVKLEWRHPDARAAGYIVEYDTNPQGDFVILAFCPAGTTSFTHPRLVPQTRFYYRVRPYYGGVTAPIKVTVAEGVSDEAYAAAYALPEDYAWAAPVKNNATAEIAQASLRENADVTRSAPAGLSAEVIKTTSSGFRLSWEDHSTDEEGFLIERKQSGDAAFSVCAMVEPDIDTFGWAFEPPQRTGEFRVRAFYFGGSSNVVTQTTGEGPDSAEPASTEAKKP